MTFDWLNKFHHDMEKESNYAEKTLAAYRLGMKAKGSIAGVVIHVPVDCCEAASSLPESNIYEPTSAPRLPLPGCSRGRRCGCVYRPFMSYQRNEEP